jgi:hypothetical protein
MPYTLSHSVPLMRKSDLTAGGECTRIRPGATGAGSQPATDVRSCGECSTKKVKCISDTDSRTTCECHACHSGTDAPVAGHLTGLSSPCQAAAGVGAANCGALAAAGGVQVADPGVTAALLQLLTAGSTPGAASSLAPLQVGHAHRTACDVVSSFSCSCFAGAAARWRHRPRASSLRLRCCSCGSVLTALQLICLREWNPGC